MRPRAFVLALLLCGGCLASRHPVWQAPGPSFGDVSDEIVAGLVADGDRAWAQRGDEKQLDEAMRAYRAALRLRPDDAGLMVHLGQIAFFRGRHLSGKSAAVHFGDAVGWAERALSARNPALAAAARSAKKPDAVFAHSSPADQAALVLYAESLLRWAIAHNIETVLDQKPWIEAAAGRALMVDRAAGYGAPDRVLAVLACEQPAARQNLREALDHFEAAVAAAPAYLPTRLLYAEEYAVRMREAPLYRRLLTEVVSADPRLLPERLPENEAAQREARDLIAHLQ